MLVTVVYRAQPGRQEELVAMLRETRFSRRRTGATSWRVWRDAGDPERVLEQFVVASWDEHLRQHDRVSRRDQDRLDRVRALTDADQPPAVTHWLTAQASGSASSGDQLSPAGSPDCAAPGRNGRRSGRGRSGR